MTGFASSRVHMSSASDCASSSLAASIVTSNSFPDRTPATPANPRLCSADAIVSPSGSFTVGFSVTAMEARKRLTRADPPP